MRKHLVWILAIAVVATTVGIAFASTSNDSTISMKVSPKQLSKTKYLAAGLNIETTTVVHGDSDPKHPTLFPDPTSKVVLKFDDDIKFDPSATQTCKASQLEGTTRAQALDACGNAKVGAGSAVACAGSSGGGCDLVIPADVLAFNGKKDSHGNPGFLLWTNNDVTGENTLPAVLKIGGSGDFGSTLTVKVPQLGGGAGSITEYQTSVKKNDYIRARCHDGDKKLNVKATFTYAANNGFNGGGPDTVTGFSKCTT
jgi:hypothetical protein